MIVLVECYHDVALVCALGVPTSALRHERGKGNILNRLRNATDIATGLLDADPGAYPPAQMQNYREKQNSHGLRLLMHAQDERRRIVEINPRLEEWLVARADASRVKLVEYSLPERAYDIHRSARCDQKPGFSRFLAALLAVDEGMKTLKKWLTE